MKTRFRTMPLVGTAVLATAMGVPLPVAAQARGDGPQPAAEIAKMQAREADDMALVLVLRPEQRPALAAFLQSMMPPPPPPRDGRGREESDTKRPADAAPPSDGFARHLDDMAADAARRSSDDTRRLAAARTFYDGLDPTQRRSFEALMRLRRGPGPEPRGAMPGGPGHGGPGRDGPGHDGPGRDGPRQDGPGHGPDGPPPIDGMPPRR